MLTGLLWAVTFIAADLWKPDPLADPSRVLQVYQGHRFEAWVMVLGSMYLAVAVVFFAAALRGVLSSPFHRAATLGGGVLLAVAMVHQGIGTFALLSAANHHDTTAIHTLGYVDAVSWLFLGAGSGAFLLAVGLGSLRAPAMPRWLAVTTIVLGVLALLGPGALAFWLLAPVWFLLSGVVPGRRGTAADAAPLGETAVAG